MRQQKLRISDGGLYARRIRPSNTGRHEPGITFHADGETALRTRFDHALPDTPRADTRRNRKLVCTKTILPAINRTLDGSMCQAKTQPYPVNVITHLCIKSL